MITPTKAAPATLSTANLVAVTGARSQSLGWNIGDVVTARVLAQTAEGLLKLQIDGQQIKAHTQLQLDAGRSVLLQVLQAKDAPILRLLTSSNDALAQHTLRQQLSRQTDLPSVFRQLSQANVSGKLPGSVANASSRLIAALPTPQQLTDAGRLKQALMDSGLFLESKLAHQGASLKPGEFNQDLKNMLLRLSRLLGTRPGSGSAVTAPGQWVVQTDKPPPLPGHQPQPQPPAVPNAPAPADEATALKTVADAGIARVEMAQLTSAIEQSQGRTAWFFELPVRHGENTDLWQIRIEQEHQRRTPSQLTPWTVQLAVHLEALGDVHARISLYGKTVSTILWAERDTTQATINASIPRLKTALEARGIAVNALVCRGGQPPPNGAASVDLLDTRA
ncbi:MAG: flagellar hook-length control protein FliK [Pseudomonadota bacterium]|nr:flagellar hook-length control protein FliK [Pseudomonadota bacterium]